MAKITVYGAGYVGLVTAVCLAEIGHHVLCMDVDPAKIISLLQGAVPFYEPGLANLLQKTQATKRLKFTTSMLEAATFATIHFIAVGTPALADGSADLRYVYDVAQQLAIHCIDKALVVNKSTVPLGTAQAVTNLLEHYSDKSLTFTVVSNPEFLREGCAINDFMHPDRIILGTDDAVAIKTLAHIYQPLLDQGIPLLTMDSVSAELTKYAANAMLATKISFINEIGQIAERSGANIEYVANALGFDKRIGPHFIAAGCGYGGSCFPKDVSALTAIANHYHYEPHLINAVALVNATQKKWLFTKIKQYYATTLANKTIAIWGLAFKPETDDMREASSIELITKLHQAGATMRLYDPVAMPQAKNIFANLSDIYYASSAYEALINADCLVIVTEWAEFKSADLQHIYQALATPIIFDGRNIFALTTIKTMGFNYISIGRPALFNHKDIYRE